MTVETNDIITGLQPDPEIFPTNPPALPDGTKLEFPLRDSGLLDSCGQPVMVNCNTSDLRSVDLKRTYAAVQEANFSRWEGEIGKDIIVAAGMVVDRLIRAQTRTPKLGEYVLSLERFKLFSGDEVAMAHVISDSEELPVYDRYGFIEYLEEDREQELLYKQIKAKLGFILAVPPGSRLSTTELASGMAECAACVAAGNDTAAKQLIRENYGLSKSDKKILSGQRIDEDKIFYAKLRRQGVDADQAGLLNHGYLDRLKTVAAGHMLQVGNSLHAFLSEDTSVNHLAARQVVGLRRLTSFLIQQSLYNDPDGKPYSTIHATNTGNMLDDDFVRQGVLALTCEPALEKLPKAPALHFKEQIHDSAVGKLLEIVT